MQCRYCCSYCSEDYWLMWREAVCYQHVSQTSGRTDIYTSYLSQFPLILRSSRRYNRDMTALFSTSGLFKVFECFAVFTCLVVHRIGNRGSQVWFGTTDFEMGYKETRNEVRERERERRNLMTLSHCLGWRRGAWLWYSDLHGNCILHHPAKVRCEVVLAVFWLQPLSYFSYLMEGREVVQSTVIDAAFCIVGAALLMTAGGQTREYSYIFLLFTIVIETFVITISVVKSEDGISDLSGGGWWVCE